MTVSANVHMRLSPSSPTAPSSTPAPSSDAPHSSDQLAKKRASTPPSSPPGFPWERQQNPGTQETGTEQSSSLAKNVFSILGKRKPLESISDNVQPNKKQPRRRKSSEPQSKFTQMRMSLGQEIQKKCTKCGMEYVASSSEDRQLHDKFHRQNTDGHDVGKDFVAKTDAPRHYLHKGVEEGDSIVMVDCFQKHHRKKRAQAVLDIVQKELGAVEVPPNEIWDADTDPGVVDAFGELQYRTFLYVRGTKCVGFLLVQKIYEAFEVLPPEKSKSQTAAKKQSNEPPPRTALEALRARKRALEIAASESMQLAEACQRPLRIATSASPAVIGVSRIWVSSAFRSQGIAMKLLGTAVEQHNRFQAAAKQVHDKCVPQAKEDPKDANKFPAKVFNKMRRVESKTDVAFSQPTEAGATLARKWFGQQYGWKVYVG